MSLAPLNLRSKFFVAMTRPPIEERMWVLMDIFIKANHFFMSNKQKILLIGLGALVIVGILFIVLKIIILNPNPSSGNVLNTSNKNKVYNVEEVINLLKTNPTFLKDKSIQVEAYVVDAVKGIDCEDFQIFTDKEYVEMFDNRFNNELSEAERNKAIENSKTAPVLFTGRTMIMPDGFYPTYHAVYQGHFYDQWASKTCGADGYKRLVIEEKVKEIVSDKQSSFRTKTISVGLVILNGKPIQKNIQKNYEVTLKDYRITINGILYYPLTEGDVSKITENTDSEMVKKWEELVFTLENGKLRIRNEMGSEFTRINYSPILVPNIDALMKSNKSVQQKREELAKLLDTFPEDTTLNDILKNWK